VITPGREFCRLLPRPVLQKYARLGDFRVLFCARALRFSLTPLPAASFVLYVGLGSHFFSAKVHRFARPAARKRPEITSALWFRWCKSTWSFVSRERFFETKIGVPLVTARRALRARASVGKRRQTIMPFGFRIAKERAQDCRIDVSRSVAQLQDLSFGQVVGGTGVWARDWGRSAP
jgi:hypothetical protein